VVLLALLVAVVAARLHARVDHHHLRVERSLRTHRHHRHRRRRYLRCQTQTSRCSTDADRPHRYRHLPNNVDNQCSRIRILRFFSDFKKRDFLRFF